jgi:hypothetical protein
VVNQPGLWGPVKIFRACREALGEKTYEVGDRKVLNPRHLDELRIAQVIAADGVNPYLTMKKEHIVCKSSRPHDFWLGPNPTLFEAHIKAKYPEYFGQFRVLAQPGDWTKPMLFVMCQRQGRPLIQLSSGALCAE